MLQKQQQNICQIHKSFKQMSKGLSNRDIIPGETLYQYLKRKKQISLKQSINQSQKIRQRQTTSGQIDHAKINSNPIQTCRSFQLNTMRYEHQQNKQNKSILANTYKSKSINDNKKQQLYEPQIYFRDSINQVSRSRSRSKSFIQMISPLKNKNISKSNVPQNVRRQNEQNIIKKHKIHNKGFIQQTLNQVKNKFEIMKTFEKEINIKFKTVTSAIASLLGQLQVKNQNKIKQECIIEKKIKKLRSNLKIFQSQLRQCNKQVKCGNQIQRLQKIMYQNLNYFETGSQKLIQNQIQKRVNDTNMAHAQKISVLNKNIYDLTRSLQLQDKKVCKIQKQYNNLLNKFNCLSDKTLHLCESNQNSYNKTIMMHKEQIQKLKELLQNQRQNSNWLSSQLKNFKLTSQQELVKVQEINKKKWFQKQLFYVKQIQFLKKEHYKQIQKFDVFVEQKQQNNDNIVRLLQFRIQKLLNQNKSLANLASVKNNQKQQAEMCQKSMKNKNQGLLNDLYRINQQLYQHWLALKDSKQLLRRLNLFDKFQIIYKDLNFNELLFS